MILHLRYRIASQELKTAFKDDMPLPSEQELLSSIDRGKKYRLDLETRFICQHNGKKRC